MHDTLQIVSETHCVSIVSDAVVVGIALAFVNDYVVVPVRPLVLVTEADCVHYFVQARIFCFCLKRMLSFPTVPQVDCVIRAFGITIELTVFNCIVLFVVVSRRRLRHNC